MSAITQVYRRGVPLAILTMVPVTLGCMLSDATTELVGVVDGPGCDLGTLYDLYMFRPSH